MADITGPSERLLKPFVEIKERLLCGAGPSNMSPRVVATAHIPLVSASPVEPQMTEIMADIRDGIRYVFQTSSQWTFCVHGPGNAAMETTSCSLIEPGEVFLIVRIGYFGYRMGLTATAHGMNVRTISKPLGEVFTIEEIEQALIEHQPTAMYIAHGESSTGVLQPIDTLGPLCHKYNCLLMVDAITSLGVVPIYMDKWEIDVIFTAQKVLGGFTGISPIAVSQTAWTKMTTRKTAIRSNYLDATLLAKMYGCVGNDLVYFHSPPTVNVYALREALASLAEEGLESLWDRQRRSAEILYEGLDKLGFVPLAKESINCLPSIACVQLPSDLKGKGELLRQHMLNEYGIIVSPGLFPKDTNEDRNVVIRIGLMGYNARPAVAHRLLAALAGTLEAMRSAGRTC